MRRASVQRRFRQRITPVTNKPSRLKLNDFSLLDITISHITVVATLPLHHRDPFDRLLIAQAVTENILILSADKIFNAYPIRRLW